MTADEYDQLYDLLSKAIEDNQDKSGQFRDADYFIGSIAGNILGSARHVASVRRAHLMYPEYTDINGIETEKRKRIRAEVRAKRVDSDF